MRAIGEISPDTKAATIRFDNGESGVEFVVGIVQRRFPNGGAWSKFVLPLRQTRTKAAAVRGAARLWALRARSRDAVS